MGAVDGAAVCFEPGELVSDLFSPLAFSFFAESVFDLGALGRGLTWGWWH